VDWALVSIEEVRRFARYFAGSPDEVEDLVYVASNMADSFAVYAHRVKSNMTDVIVGFAFLCKLSIPGKPPADDRTRRKVELLMRISRKRQVHLFYLPASAVNAIPGEMSPLNLLVDLDALASLELFDYHVEETPAIRSRYLRLTPFRNVVEKLNLES
jgi:hypothetical protein